MRDPLRHAAGFLALSAYFGFLLLRPIDLSTADLGRHISNGKWVFDTSAVLSTDFYSYTQPEFPFANHHWGSGVIFYLVHQWGGFPALSFLYLIVGLATLLIMTVIAVREWGWLAASGAALVTMPLLSYRAEIRPEVFSYFFAAIFYGLLRAWKRSQIRWEAIFALPILMIVWVNLHIYFFFGFFIMACFGFEIFWESRHSSEPALLDPRLIRLLQVMGLCLGASLVNPMGYALALEPFRIFQNYGYMIVENQSVPFFLERGLWLPIMVPFYVVALAWVGLNVLTRKRALEPSLLLIGSAALLMAAGAIRNLTLFGFFALPGIAVAWHAISTRFARKGLLTAAFLGLACFTNANWIWSLGHGSLKWFQIGLSPGAERAAEFFRQNGIRGPIFNNYDIGSYLIYELFPQEKVFVDNRPEAYSASFLQDVYVHMQEDEGAWKEQARKYGFNVIFFGWHDLTPWAQHFLIERVKDPEWAPIYVDPYALILVRRNEQNAGLIKKFEISKDRFHVGA